MSNRSLLVSIASLTLLTACGMGSNTLRTGTGPLAPCSTAPHCVSSGDPTPERSIAPLAYTGTVEAAKTQLKTAVLAMPGTAIISESPDYIHATYSTAIMKYVDDVEFLFAKPGVIDVRSSSRMGYYDAGMNRKRVEAIRAAMTAR